MYDSSYEEYMRSVLGYTPSCMQDTFVSDDYYIMQNDDSRMNVSNMEELYPDIYKRVYPLVCQECNTNTMPMTREVLERMTDNVLNRIEVDLKIQTNVKVETRKEDMKGSNVRTQESTTRQEDRAPRRNDTLRDLIRILILREIIGERFPIRPPFRPRPPMPGPGRPPFPGGRPPFPRDMGVMSQDF